MIARVFPWSSSFHRVCQYVAQDQERSIVLDTGGVRAHDYRLMARDFEIIHSLHDTRNKPVFHGVIDFHPNESVDDKKMVEIAQKYLVQMGLDNTQYAVVKHLDTRLKHMHIVANRIDYEGQHIDMYPEILRSNDIIRELVKAYDLIPAGKKDLRQTNFDALDNFEVRKYAIFRTVTECLPGCRDFEELQQRLIRHDIDVRFHTDPDTGRKMGISFGYQNVAFKGGDIDADLSFKSLERKLSEQLKLSHWTDEKLAERQALDRQEKEQKKQILQQQATEEVRELHVRKHRGLRMH